MLDVFREKGRHHTLQTADLDYYPPFSFLLSPFTIQVPYCTVLDFCWPEIGGGVGRTSVQSVLNAVSS
jgi:hypothetical protein